MSTTIKLLTDTLAQVKGMTLMTLADFSDADMLHRPCDKANHATWQLGHLATATLSMIGGVDPSLAPPADKAAQFAKETSGSDDASKFPNKAAVIAYFTDSIDKAIAWAGKLSEADLTKPGPEMVRQFAPELINLPIAISIHTAMHMGQFQVIRRSLGKPLLF